MLRKDETDRRIGDFVRGHRRRNGRKQDLVSKASRRNAPDAQRNERDRRKALEAVDPFGKRSLPQDGPSAKVADNSCGQSEEDRQGREYDAAVARTDERIREGADKAEGEC